MQFQYKFSIEALYRKLVFILHRLHRVLFLLISSVYIKVSTVALLVRNECHFSRVGGTLCRIVEDCVEGFIRYDFLLPCDPIPVDEKRVNDLSTDGDSLMSPEPKNYAGWSS